MDESDPFADDDGVESIVDEEGDLFYADEDETAVLEVNDQEYRGIFWWKWRWWKWFRWILILVGEQRTLFCSFYRS